MDTQTITDRPADIKIKHYYQKTPDILLDHEIKPLLDEAINHSLRDYTIILLALNTGLRRNEILGLNVGDIMPFKNIVQVLELPARIAKGQKPRSIPLNKKIRDHLAQYLHQETQSKKIDGSDSPLFRTHYSNKRYRSRNFNFMIQRHAIRAINRNCYPHMLRHTFATKLIRQANIKIVQEILGHSNMQNTQIYLHPSTSEKIEAVNKLDIG